MFTVIGERFKIKAHEYERQQESSIVVLNVNCVQKSTRVKARGASVIFRIMALYISSVLLADYPTRQGNRLDRHILSQHDLSLFASDTMRKSKRFCRGRNLI